jgi:aminopeptidase N
MLYFRIVTINLPIDTAENDWIIGNLKHAGFYRVNYDSKSWDLLIKQLNDDHDLIDRVSRAQLIDDSFNLGRAEIIDQTVFLKINQYLVKESSPLAFIPAFNGLNIISSLISTEVDAFDAYKV